MCTIFVQFLLLKFFEAFYYFIEDIFFPSKHILCREHLHVIMSLINERNAIAMASGSLSSCSSLLIAIMIPRAQGGLSTPYHRIIFGLSISDIIQSIAIMPGPFFVPSDENTSESLWVIGNFYTCQFQAFAFTSGVAATCMYALFLCLYYYCKLKRNMNDAAFANKIEKKMHCFIVLFNLAVCLSALATKTFNSLYKSGSCQLTKKAYGCDPSVHGTSQNVRRTTVLQTVGRRKLFSYLTQNTIGILN
jgi:hypothetical protein